MLKKPYKLIDSKNYNNYYLLENDFGELYLATEYVEFTGSKYKKEITKGLSLLAIDYYILKLFLAYSEVNHLGYAEVDWGLEKEDRYETLDLAKLKADIERELKYLEIEIQLDNVPEKEKDILNIMLGNGHYELYTTSTEGRQTNYTLVRTSKLGYISIVKFTVWDGELISNYQSFSFEVETIKKFLEEVQKSKLFKVFENNNNNNKEEIN